MKLQNLKNIKMQLASIEFQFNSLLTQIQNLGFIQNTNFQLNNISIQMLNLGIQILNIGNQPNDDSTMNNYSSKEQINNLKNFSNNNMNQEANLMNKIENENLKSEINELRNEIEKLKGQQIKVKGKFEDSKIISTNEYDMISNWISPIKGIEVNLLYRASRDGDKAKDFHDRCDNKGSTFCIFELENGYKIGGYSSVSWTDQKCPVKDENAFICSITNKEKYELKIKNSYSVYHCDYIGPDFYDNTGYADIYIFDNCLKRKDGIQVWSNAYNSSMKKLTGIESASHLLLKLKDYEVYQIL